MNGLVGTFPWLWDVLLPLGVAAGAYLGWATAVALRGLWRIVARRVRRRVAARRVRRELGALVVLPEWATRPRPPVRPEVTVSTVGNPTVELARQVSDG